MDEDMLGTEETNQYPDPDFFAQDPYPALDVIAANEDQPESDPASFQREAAASYDILDPAVAAEKYRILAGKFTSGDGGQQSGQIWRFPGRDGAGYGPPDTAPQPWTLLRSRPADDEDETEDDVELLGRPKENAFLHTVRPIDHGDDDDDPDTNMANETDAASEEDAADGPAASKGGKSRAVGKAARKRGWKQLLKGTTHDPALNRDDPRRARGTGRRARGRARAVQKFDPGRDFKNHLQNANQAYLKGDFEEATEEAILAVKANPEIFQAHNLLSDCLEKLGRNQDAIAALMCGAYTARDPKVWLLVAERTLSYAGEQRSLEDLDQALFCYSTAVKMQPESYDARVAKLQILFEKEDWAKARLEAKALIRLRPEDLDNKKMFAELCVMSEDLNEIHRAMTTYEEAFQAMYEKDAAPHDFANHWSHLNMYLDLVERVGNPAEGIFQLKKLARWFLGRKDEIFWDSHIADDREFDIDFERRAYVSEVQRGQASADPSRYGDGLPLELRVKCGIFRIKMGNTYVEEALRHFSVLLGLSDEITEYYDMFYQAAEALRIGNQLEEAIDYYKPILEVPDIANIDLHLGLARCYSGTDRLALAIECLEQAHEIDKGSTEVRLQLMKAYEANGQSDAVLRLAQELRKGPLRTLAADHATQSRTIDDDISIPPIDSCQLRPRALRTQPSIDSNTAPVPTRRRAYNVKSYAWHRSKEDELTAFQHYAELKHISSLLSERPNDAGMTQQWMSTAAVLVNLFRSVSIFFPDREPASKRRGLGPLDNQSENLQRDMQLLRKKLEKGSTQVNDDVDEDGDENAPPRLEGNMPLDFLNIPFTTWHRIIVDFALHAARIGQREISYDTIQEGLFKANVFFYDKDLHNTSLATAICVALIYNDSHWLHNIARRFVTGGDYHAGATFQLMAALARSTYGPNHYAAGPSQKFMLRMIKIQDGLALTGEMRDKVDLGTLQRAIETRVEKYGNECDLDAGLLLLYGHQVAAATQSYSAIPYYLRAHVLNPESACILLSLAVVHIQNAMKRQTDNRQYGIAMGLSFLSHYSAIRRANNQPRYLQEVEYNVGRVWHTLGLTDLAVPYYERALDMSGKVRAEEMSNGHRPETVEDFSVEAALALQNIYALAGNHEAAMQITEQWLVI